MSHAARIQESIFLTSTFWRVRSSLPGGEIRQPEKTAKGKGERGTYAQWCPKELASGVSKINSAARSFLHHQGRHMKEFAPGCYMIKNLVFQETLERMKAFEAEFDIEVGKFEVGYREEFDKAQAYINHTGPEEERPERPTVWAHLTDKELTRIPTPEEVQGKYHLSYRWFTVGAAKTGNSELDSSAFADLQNDLFLSGDEAMFAELLGLLEDWYSSLAEKQKLRVETMNNLEKWCTSSELRNLSGNPEIRSLSSQIMSLLRAVTIEELRKNTDLRTEMAAEAMTYVNLVKPRLGGRDLEV